MMSEKLYYKDNITSAFASRREDTNFADVTLLAKQASGRKIYLYPHFLGECNNSSSKFKFRTSNDKRRVFLTAKRKVQKR